MLQAPRAAAQDLVFENGFEPGAGLSEAAAARFLTQASFGPNRASIAHLRSIGRDAWIDEQLALTPTLARPYLENLQAQGVSVAQSYRVNRFLHSALAAPDQLRQRVAFALSEILVISDQPDNLTNDWAGVAEYQDILTGGAFGSYRDLLRAVALSPQMGRYLSHWRNRKAFGQSKPDENFAREILQLFSIGLHWRNSDFSLMLDGNGQPIPTYDQSVVTELSEVFTGLAMPCPQPPGLCNPYSGLTAVFESYQPMACFPLFHDLSSKLLFDLDPGPAVNQVVLPAGPACDPEPPDGSALEAQCFAYCNDEIDAVINAIAMHPNVAPFISRQLIQRLVSSNPSAAYVERVASVFQSTAGNLGAVVKAILLDPEAVTFDLSAPGFGQPDHAGHLREPLLRATAVWRAFEAQPGVCDGSCMGIANPPPDLVDLRMYAGSLTEDFAQRPLGAASVFNFFEPDYRAPGAVTMADLYTPEFQILDETTSATAGNALLQLVWSGYHSFSLAFTQPTQAAYLPPAVVDGLPQDSAQLLDELNLRMLYGSMSGSYTVGNCSAGSGMQGVLYELLACAMNGAEHRRKVLGAIHLIAISPEFSIQR
ncbi:MAG: DUF1800 family protein [Xanthomonadales bacterium]|nr:DUF1800 family protein [Xanthomonadales bacterium]